MKNIGLQFCRLTKSVILVLKSCDYYIFDDKMLAEDIPIIPPKEDKLNVSTNSYDPQPLTEVWIVQFAHIFTNLSF